MKQTARQIAAFIGIGLLLLLYILTFIFAICDFEGSNVMFRACLMGTFVIPMLIWAYIYLYDRMKANRDGKNNDNVTTIHK